MEMLYNILALIFAVLISVYTWKVLNMVWFIPKKLEKSLRQQGFKGNPYRFLFGDFKEMTTGSKEALSKPIGFSADVVPRIIPFIHNTVTNYNGQNCFIWLGPYPAVLISDPENIREILSKSYIFQKPYNPLGKMLAQGLASYDTDKWAKHRRLINPAFQMDKIKNMLPSFYASCCDMLSTWENVIEPSEGQSFELDVWPYLQTLTSDAISRTAFGSSYEGGRKIFELQKEQASLLMKSFLSVFIPGWRFVPTKTNTRMKKILKDVNLLVLGIIKKRMKAIEEGEASNDDLLDTLLESNLKEIKQHGNKFGMSLEDVIEECKLFYTAGQETTSVLLVWTMILLSKHLDWQARAREEIRQVTMILHEVLRLYPPGPLLSRTIHKETELGDITLPAGVQIILPAILLHHDCNIWGDDAKEFNPERFSEGVLKATKGQKMALAMILQNYTFELSPSYAHAPRTVITLQPQHGQNSFIWVGPYPAVLISDPENIREVLSKSYIFQKPYNPLGKMLAQGLATYETDKWAKHKRLINPAFQMEKIKNMLPSFYASCCDMLSTWENIIITSEGQSFELDVWPYLQTLTSDAISRTAFGSSYEEGRKIFELQREQVSLLKKSFLSVFIPGWRFVPTKTNTRMKKILKDVNLLVLGIIKKRMKAIEEGEASNDDLLDILLESNLKEIKQHGNKFGMSLEDVIEECKLFYIAGQETTSVLLVWTMILLSKHLDWQARAREEVRQVTMILHEVLRLYPPVSLLSRTIHKETELGDITLPAGVQIILPAILLHHDCNIWGDDAKDFNPERFSEGVLKATKGQSTYFPFGLGPRECLGQNFAMFEAKMALAMILQNYTFELSPSYSHAPRIVIALQPQHGAHLIFRKCNI
ncbi:hypothetical protein ACJIZ3_007295 [Penstemon smallii]|uniref:Cytochrome P450 n=1 Tax=Penstemon smallii TaxID=265156 RepID=A0ABD3SA48_9LAMI